MFNFKPVQILPWKNWWCNCQNALEMIFAIYQKRKKKQKIVMKNKLSCFKEIETKRKGVFKQNFKAFVFKNPASLQLTFDNPQTSLLIHLSRLHYHAFSSVYNSLIIYSPQHKHTRTQQTNMYISLDFLSFSLTSQWILPSFLFLIFCSFPVIRSSTL